MRHLLIGIVLVGLVVCAGLGCDSAVRPSIPSAPEGLSIYSTLQAGDSTQYAVVTTPRAADQQDLQYVQDASVNIAGRRLAVVPEDSIRVVNRSPELPGEDKANYVAEDLHVRPGQRYQLRVEHERDTITGTAQVPGRFTITAEGLTIQWTDSEGAQRYKLHVQHEIEREDEGGARVWTYETITSTTSATVDTSSNEGDFEAGEHSVVVTAVDSNLAEYRDGEVQRSGINDGFGFFGAATQVGKRVSLPAPKNP